MASSRSRTLAMVVAALLAAQTLSGTAQAADLVDVTVRIRCLQQVENPDTASGDGDYFPEVKIDDHPFSIHPDLSGPFGPGPVQDDTFCPDWRFTRQVDRDGPIDVVIRLWDDDGGMNFGGDLMDINPKSGKVELFVRYSGHSGRWAVSESDVQGNIARGNGDHDIPEANDGRIAQIDFEVFVGTSPDRDGDGIPDAIENNGVRRPDGSLVTDLRVMGATACRPTVVVWIDYMTGAADGHSHEPKGDAIAMVADAFDKAPIDMGACPYGGNPKTKGAEFIYLKGRPLTEQPVLTFPHRDGDTVIPDSGFRAAKNANFPTELRPYAHYAIFAHDLSAGSATSGLCCDDDGNGRDFLVTLGSWRTTCVAAPPGGTLATSREVDDVKVGETIEVGPNRRCDTTATGDDEQWLDAGTGAADARVGTVLDQAGTLMHELGHSLGLGHGGHEKVNNKPNYLSVMNYSFQGGLPRGETPPGADMPPRFVDYSRDRLDSLDKRRLRESDGIGTDVNEWTRFLDSAGDPHWSSAVGAIDWDWSDTIDNGSVICADGLSGCVAVDVNANNDAEEKPDVLEGYNDWAKLKFRAVDSPWAASVNAAGHPSIPERTFREAGRAELQLAAFFDPDLRARKTADKTVAEGGDAITYAVNVHNVGTGPAAGVTVRDAFPAGHGKTSESRTLGTLYEGKARTETFKLTVDCATPDGTVLVNRATVSGTDMARGAELNLTNNTSTASTTVRAPKLDVEKTATATVNAGEAVTYGVTVENAGTAAATGVVVTDVLPAGMYYSPALDLGAGPRPDAVTRMSDGSSVLVWNLKTLAGGTTTSIEYTARPSLLFVAGDALDTTVQVVYGNANGCVFAPEVASATTTITAVEASGDPKTIGFWRNHDGRWTDEMRARVQATDQRYDADGDGMLSAPEVGAELAPAGNVLEQQLLATLFDLATRRINAETAINSRLTRSLGLENVREAALYAQETLSFLLTKENRDRYSDATTVLDEINNNRSPVY